MYSSKPLCTSEPQASLVRPQLFLWQWDRPPPCMPQAVAAPGDNLGHWGILLQKLWFLLKGKISAQYQVTWVSQKNIWSLTRNWGFSIGSFSSQYFVAQGSTRTSYSMMSYQPAAAATGNQAQHQPHHYSRMPRVRGTRMLPILHKDLQLFLYFSFLTCVCRYQAYVFLNWGSGMTQEWKAACSISRRPRNFSTSLNTLRLFQHSAKRLLIPYTSKMLDFHLPFFFFFP